MPRPLFSYEAQPIQLDDWNQQLGSVCGSFQTSAATGRVMGAVSARKVLGIDIASVNVGPSTITRSAVDAVRDDFAHYFLIAQGASQSHIQQCGRSALLEAGDLILVDSTQASQFVYEGTAAQAISCQVSMHIPRGILPDSVAKWHIGQKISKQSELAKCVWQQLAALNDLADLLCDPRLQVDAFQDLFIRTFTQIFSSERHQDKFVQLVLSLLQECDQGAAAVDHYANLSLSSRRTFFRIFQSRNVSFGELVRFVRLLRFLKLLRNYATAPEKRSISAIALEAGFTDISNFNHVFKAHFGLTPRALLPESQSS